MMTQKKKQKEILKMIINGILTLIGGLLMAAALYMNRREAV